jgi:hypothetical protein
VIRNGLTLLKASNAEAHGGIAEELGGLEYMQKVFSLRETSVLPRRAAAFKVV